MFEKTAERGFTLVELLVTVAIIGILAAVALPVYSQYRTEAVDAQMHAAIRSARNAMEAYYESNQYSYGGVTLADLEEEGMRTGDVTVVVEDATDTSYRVRACIVGGTVASYVFDADEGASVPSDAGCS